MTREELLTEGVAAKFIRYVQIDTQSDENAETSPSTPGQWELARLLQQELETLGLSEVMVDDHGFVTATLESNLAYPSPVIGLLAHMDTAVGVPSRNVRPLRHHYQGGDLHLPHATLSPRENPTLEEVVGHELITSDGSTLLGADDKAGIAEIMEVLCRLLRNPSLPHGRIRVAFTPDEEIGKGIDYFPIERFGADFAYTLDGGPLGELEGENFNALNFLVTIHGISSHTGDARGKMINAVQLASEMITGIPATMRPETTLGREGFLHADEVEGRVERVKIRFLVRDFTEEGLRQKEALLRHLGSILEAKYPGARVEYHLTGSYQNMKAALDQDPRVMSLAVKAMEMLGIQPRLRAIRGGTDGARLCQAGLLTPNLFTGGDNFHSRKEWVSVQWMESAVLVVLNLLQLWARERK